MSDKEISNRANLAINDYLDHDKIMWGRHMSMYPSIQYFYESGKVSGELHNRINLMLCSFGQQITSIQTAQLREEVERLKKENDGWKDLVDRSNSVLRSAASIAERKGEYTNWDGFLKQTELVLKEQHTLFYPKYIKS